MPQVRPALGSDGVDLRRPRHASCVVRSLAAFCAVGELVQWGQSPYVSGMHSHAYWYKRFQAVRATSRVRTLWSQRPAFPGLLRAHWTPQQLTDSPGGHPTPSGRRPVTRKSKPREPALHKAEGCPQRWHHVYSRHCHFLVHQIPHCAQQRTECLGHGTSGRQPPHCRRMAFIINAATAAKGGC